MLSVALVVAGQIRMLAEPGLVRNWEEAVLEPLRPTVFMSLNADWRTANPSGRYGDGSGAQDEVVAEIQRVFAPTYCAVTKGMVHLRKGSYMGGSLDWFRAWADAYRGLREHERAVNKKFDVVLHGRPDLYFRMKFTPDFFDNAAGLSFGLLMWDAFAAMSRDVADVRLGMIDSDDFGAPFSPEYCRGPWDQCNLMWIKARQPEGASIVEWPKGTLEVRIQRNCSHPDQKDFWINTYHGICLSNRNAESAAATTTDHHSKQQSHEREKGQLLPRSQQQRQSRAVVVERGSAAREDDASGGGGLIAKHARKMSRRDWVRHFKCTETYACKNEKNFQVLLRCAKAAHQVKSHCACQHWMHWDLKKRSPAIPFPHDQLNKEPYLKGESAAGYEWQWVRRTNSAKPPRDANPNSTLSACVLRCCDDPRTTSAKLREPPPLIDANSPLEAAYSSFGDRFGWFSTSTPSSGGSGRRRRRRRTRR
mmetsp:Transcript_837/g.2365  ORF Transcript_837/g.2365 Transcript_837/m.2365 type:complete len:478 (-) Transcript_837:214-1647(-)